MNEKRFREIVSELKYYELDSAERQFVEAANRLVGREGQLTGQQESDLEELYRRKEDT